ncbi:MAG: HD domain-containing protein [Calditrichaeota bacterium]|nr:HD domain-containing protein [Calditrichota bacterium]
MDQNQYAQLEQWYNNYFREFESHDADVAENIKLKRDHTFRVCEETVRIGESLRLHESDLLVAKTAALFHDVGRFEQYKIYRTFLDMKSVNHAELAVEILQRYNVLISLHSEEKILVEKAILFHNKKDLPADESERMLMFARILRDADKLDIWRIVLDHYHNSNGEGNGAIEFGLPDTPSISDGACRSLLRERLVDVKDIRNVNDFKLLLLGWIYDLNFSASLQAAHERGYVEQLEQLLPDSKELGKCMAVVKGYLARKITNEKIA